MATQEAPMLLESTPATTSPPLDQARYLIIVARDQMDLWRYLRQNLAEYQNLEVVLDRRHGGRWQWTQMRQFEDRGTDRRTPSSEADLTPRSFVIVPKGLGSVA
jgi:hypothetical protein